MANQFTGRHGWTDERIALLKQLVREGYSGGLIAARMGVTRSSVIGKVVRLGMQLGNTRNSQRNLDQHLRLKANYTRRKKAGDRLRPPPPKVRFTVEPLPVQNIEDVARKSLLDLNLNDCRYPVGDPKTPGFGFCALERVPGSAYCHAHKERCSGGLPPKTRQKPVLARETAPVKETADA